jgi:hypothetical protein
MMLVIAGRAPTALPVMFGGSLVRVAYAAAALIARQGRAASRTLYKSSLVAADSNHPHPSRAARTIACATPAGGEPRTIAQHTNTP